MAQDGILHGVRVLDFSRYIAGPYCAALLAGLGADVVRIEKPGGGEDRFVGPVAEGLSAIFLKTGLNKRSMTLDLTRPGARAVVERLVGGADVVIANMPPAVLARMGLDYETLAAIRPDIVLTTQTCFGHTGPWSERGGFDGIAQMMSGAAWFSGTPGQPQRTAAPLVDFSTAVLGAFGTLAALVQRDATGVGQHVQASLLGSALTAMSGPLLEQAVLGLNREPSGNRGQIGAPADVFRASDGHLTTLVLGDGLFRRLARVVGQPQWVDDPRFASDELRGEHRDEICDAVAAWVAARGRDAAVEELAAAGVPCGPVLDLVEALAHPQVQAMQFMQQIAVAGLANTVPAPRMPLDFSAWQPPHAPPPRIGEHTEAVLGEAGYSSAEIDALRADGVI